MTPPAVMQADLARRWSRLHPQLAPAIARALALVGGVSRVAPDHYEVEGASETYRVRVYPSKPKPRNPTSHDPRSTDCPHQR